MKRENENVAWWKVFFLTGMKFNAAGQVFVGLAVLATALTGFLTYGSVLQYFFTGSDTLTLIDTSRVAEAKDILKSFTKPLMDGSVFVSRGQFFRPVSNLSYSLDHYIWNIDPYGYHLTNLILHIAVIALIFLFVRELTKGDIITAWCCAAVFSLHPILVETVPAPDRRHDILSTLFILLSLWLFLKSHHEGFHRAGSRIMSIVCYVLALGAKEIAVYLPCLVFVYEFIFSDESSLQKRLELGIKASAPYLCVTMVYLLWRTQVLGGLGGYTEQSNTILEALGRGLDITVLYLSDLIYPQDFLHVYEVIPKTVFILSLVLLIGCCLYLLIKQSSKVDETSQACSSKQLNSFLATWLVFPLLISVITSTFSHRCMYNAVIPFSTLIVFTMVWNYRYLASMFEEVRSASLFQKIFHAMAQHKTNLVVFTLSIVMTASLFAYSPLIQPYEEWEDSSRMSALVLQKLKNCIRGLPQDATIHLYNLPSCISGYVNELPRARDIGYLNDYSIKSWLNLECPGNRIKVAIHSRYSPNELPEDVELHVKNDDPKNAFLFFTFTYPTGTIARAIRRWQIPEVNSYIW